ncbi:MAG: Crp/Fnr family transcriptional regulator, partial [Coriobacteriales bacterium]|nr:Crp/Fnr family transcriptional regulator [Coriobacteriales bacterium]
MSAPEDLRADVWAAFRACRLWRAATDSEVTELVRKATVRQVSRGERLATEGEPATQLGVVVSGKARVFYLGADGRQIVFETPGAGEPLAAVAALASTRYPANIEAATDGTIAFLPVEALLDLITEDPEVARYLIADLSRRVVNFMSVVQTLALDVPSRLARFIFQRTLSGGKTTPRGVEIELGMKKGELAMALGTVPETLSRELHKLKDDGLIDVQGQTVTELDVRALAH